MAKKTGDTTSKKSQGLGKPKKQVTQLQTSHMAWENPSPNLPTPI